MSSSSTSAGNGRGQPPSAYMSPPVASLNRCAVHNCQHQHHSHKSAAKYHQLTSEQLMISAFCFPAAIGQQQPLSKERSEICHYHLSQLLHYAAETEQHFNNSMRHFSHSWNSSSAAAAAAVTTLQQVDEDQCCNGQHADGQQQQTEHDQANATVSVTMNSYQNSSNRSLQQTESIPLLLVQQNSNNSHNNTNSAISSRSRVNSSHNLHQQRSAARRSLLQTHSTWFDTSATSVGWIVVVAFIVIVALYVIVGLQNGH